MIRRLGILTFVVAWIGLGAGGAAAADPLAPNPRASYALIEGSGSTWSKNIVDQWISDVDSNGMKVTYNGGGSSQGRKSFAQNVTDFGISEIPYQGVDEQGQADNSNGREYAYLPIVAGGTAFSYQIKVGNQMVRNLRLSGETIAKIFTNQITDWSDPAITKDNNGRQLPKLAITPVVRSDGSGTTAQFTTWMDSEQAGIWRPFFGKSGLTSYYPRKGRAVAQSGSDQVMNYVAGGAGNGSIGYVEYSYATNKKYPVVKVLNAGGYYVEPTHHNVAVALTQAKINQDRNSQLYLTQILDGVYRAKDPRAYPLSSYSYLILPVGAKDQRMTTAKRQTLADFMYYSLCTGQSKAGQYGYSPLPLNLVQAGFQQLARLKDADPEVDLTSRDVTKCNNPTFVAGDLKRNRLAEVAPQPAACDKVGAGPCGTATGANQPSTDETAGGKKGKKGGATTTDTSGGDPGALGASDPGATVDAEGNPVSEAPTAIDPETGLPTDGGVPGAAADGAAAVVANPTELTAGRSGDRRAFGWIAAVELLALILVPGLVAVTVQRRRTAKGAR